MPIVFGFANYLDPADDRCARHGVSPAERVQLLDDRIRRLSSLFQLARRLRPLWSGKCSRRRLVRLRPLDFSDVLARTQYRLLDICPADFRCRQYRSGDQIVATVLCLRCPGMTARENANVAMAVSRDGLSRGACRRSAYGCANHAATRSLPGRALLRHAGRRLRCNVDALLLDLRPSGSLHAGHARFRLRF